MPWEEHWVLLLVLASVGTLVLLLKKKRPSLNVTERKLTQMTLLPYKEMWHSGQSQKCFCLTCQVASIDVVPQYSSTSQGAFFFFYVTYTAIFQKWKYKPSDMVVVQQDRAVRRHQHVSGEINTQRQQNLSLQVQRATLLRSHSSVYLSWKTSSSVSSLLFFWTVWTVSTVTRDFGRASTVRAGSLNPRPHRTFWDLVPKQKPTKSLRQ